MSRAYHINKSGTWPNEVYAVAISANVIDPNLGFLPAENMFRFFNDPLLSINYLANYDYRSADTVFDGLGLSQLNTYNNTLLVWNLSAERRRFNIGNTFNSFSINTLPGTPIVGRNTYYNYLLYPNRLILKPTGKPTWNGSNWVLNTQTQLLRDSTYFYNVSTVDRDAANQHEAFLLTPPTTDNIPSNANYSIVYNLCSVRTRVDNPVITFDSVTNPFYYTTILESTPSTDRCKIRPDSTFISYAVNFYAKGDNQVVSQYSIGQARPDSNSSTLPTFKSGYIMNYNPAGSNPNLQAFQLLQIKEDGTATPTLDDIRYCVLSGVFDLQNSTFRYFAKNYQLSNQSIVNVVTGIPGTSIGLSYIADCPTMQFSQERWQDTITSVSTPLGVPVATNVLPSSVTWTTKYPPHYYSFKAHLTGSNEPVSLSTLETGSLTFYLFSSAISAAYTQFNYTTAVTLSTYIVSDFNFIQYDLSSTGQNDYIKFTPINTPSVVLSSIQCFYGSNLSIPYSLIDTPWVPAHQATRFAVTYPVVTHGELGFSLRPSLCSIAGYMDSNNATPISLAVGQRPLNIGQPIFISKTIEKEDFIEVDSSFLISASSWPTRDLTNSFIIWNFTPANSFVTINAVDVSGNYIQQIPSLSAVVFSPKTWSVVVSGYGPQATVITLSSQKYNETTSLTSVSSLFNYFAEGSLLVGPSIPLNNFEKTRTLSLTAAVPYKGRQYNLPSDISVNWTWLYDGSIDYDTVPVSAYSIPQNFSSYDYAENTNTSLVSAMHFKIVPPYATQNPSLHDISIKASVDTIDGLVEGSYAFQVDDFPDPSIFNTDFGVYYTIYPNLSDRILSTRDNKNVITRPNNGTNNFSLSAFTDILPYLPDGSIVWNTNGILSYGNYSNNIVLTNASQTIVTLSALSATVAGWNYPHSVYTSVNFYILNPSDFYQSLEFNVYPEYFWLNSQYLTISNQNNYTLASSPTAYANKISNSQTFWLSANKQYLNDFSYYTGSQKNKKLPSVNSNISLVDIPYESEIFTNNGLQLSLTAFNDSFYPSYNGIYYKMPIGNQLVELPFYIVSETSNDSFNIFQTSPKVIPYSTINLSYTASVTSINLDTARNIAVTQNIFTKPLITPAIPYDGTITYTLSSQYWAVNKDVPITNGSYDLFNLIIGDSINPLTVNGTKKNTLFLTASANITSKIFPSTFDNVVYLGERDLWNPATQIVTAISGNTPIVANSTTGNPEVYISTTYALTGYPILLQYYTPYKSENFQIIAYMTDFGEENSTLLTAFDTPIYYSYKNKGTFYISYSALFNDGSVETFIHPNPITIRPSWDIYDPNNVRFTYETILTLPYELNDVLIQPNEWGDADIFNTAITRLQDNIDYLAGNVQTLNTSSPTVYFGWLGCNQSNLADGIRWYTKDYGTEYYLNPSLATTSGPAYFTNIVDAIDSINNIFVLDGTTFRAFSADYTATEITLAGASDLKSTFLSPISIAVDETGTLVYVADPLKNKIYRLDLELNIEIPTVNYSLNLGGLGTVNDTNKFNSPSELVYENGSLFVLDYNNYCVKQYNRDLNWLYTYITDEFTNDHPINITIHPFYKFVYILTKSKTIYVFDELSNTYFASFKIDEVSTNTNNPIIKIILDDTGDFLYVLTKTTAYKYSSSGYFVTNLSLPSGVNYISAKKSKNKHLLFITSNSIIKVQDILEIHKIGSGLDTNYWTKDQLVIGKDEFASDINYNRSLVRIGQNIKSFRNSMNAKLVLATEQTTTNVVTYFTSVPISNKDLPIFDGYVENDSSFVGVNELHTPQTINKMLTNLYGATSAMKSFLDITTFNINNNSNNQGTCANKFCWSWKAMSCYNLSLPAIRICNINPITYAELEANFPVSYAPSKTWVSANSDCCNNVTSPV
jgi:hypothetical protein